MAQENSGQRGQRSWPSPVQFQKTSKALKIYPLELSAEWSDFIPWK